MKESENPTRGEIDGRDGSRHSSLAPPLGDSVVFTATVGTRQGGQIYRTERFLTASEAITAASRTTKAGNGDRVRVGVQEDYRKIFWAQEDTLAATKAARKMDTKSHAGNGR